MAMIELRKEVETAALAELNRANANFRYLLPPMRGTP